MLTVQNVATTKPKILNNGLVSPTTPPKFEWQAQGGSDLFPNNYFVLVFYDGSGEEILRTASTTGTTYTLTQAEWEAVLYSYGVNYTVAVAAKQTNAPITGEYISERTNPLNKPLPNDIVRTHTFFTLHRYSEQIEQLQPRQALCYNVIFTVPGQKIIQTFGAGDTILYLYDSAGNLLAMDDDSGYGVNAFLHYNFEADVQYQIKAKFYGDYEFGPIKVAVVPATTYLEEGSNSFNSFEDILSLSIGSQLSMDTSAVPNETRMFVCVPSVGGEYTIEIQSGFDTFLYVIDPRTTEKIEHHVNFDDDTGEGLNSLLTFNFEAGVPYLIIFSAHDPTSLTQEGDLMLYISKED